ncbi:30S ribosomal protein s3 chloroplastic [Phtheirospermum japonicum]|uniref:30S ribosomal protein s3 chloroplastic n=1 Tax=Phtheirospermum japonicum TaxID=374723 RepID=A0A830D978_9LAMI|nr:30S ribosomal protein s3 chloroplastic [Phtheirospermum japonicum]
MGQKINPLCFRLGTTQSHHSIWFDNPKIIPRVYKKIKKIRDLIKKLCTKEYENILWCRGNCRIEI